MVIDPVSAVLTIGSAVFGGLGGNAEAKAQNRAAEAQYKQNLQSWKYGKKRIKADYRQEKKQWKYNIENEETLAAWKDSTNLQDWDYAKRIQDTEYAQQMRQFDKSEKIFGQQLTFNQMAQSAAVEAEYRKLEDSTKEIAFQNQDLVIKAVQAEGVAAVKGQQGRSAQKGEQAEFASLGRNQAILAESLLSARADTDAAMRKIASDRFGADLAAEAARMLKPDRVPVPPKPLTTPRAKFLEPRKPKTFDFGPKPIKGAMASSTGAWMGAASNIASGIAAAATSGNKYNFSLNNLSANPYTLPK
jgi:hypothetical protein